jgi:hypothetical protein
MRFRVGLNALLGAYPQAQIIGIDQPDVVLTAARGGVRKYSATTLQRGT